MSAASELVIGIVGGVVAPLLFARGIGLGIVGVEDEETVLVTSFGRLVHRFDKPGPHMLLSKVMPWVQVIRVSRARDYRTYAGLHVHDRTGTIVSLELWLELRVTDPERATFAVDDWDRALENVSRHCALTVLATHSFVDMLRQRLAIGEQLREEIAPEAARWGVSIEQVHLADVQILPEVSQRFFATVAARLERTKAAVEEEGRLKVAELDAETDGIVAQRVAEAKAQYPLAVGQALAEVGKDPVVLAAYESLYELSVIRPHRTVAFQNFEGEGITAQDAAMMLPPATAQSHENRQ